MPQKPVAKKTAARLRRAPVAAPPAKRPVAPVKSTPKEDGGTVVNPGTTRRPGEQERLYKIANPVKPAPKQDGGTVTNPGTTRRPGEQERLYKLANPTRKTGTSSTLSGGKSRNG